jgi:hypothetical protein
MQSTPWERPNKSGSKTFPERGNRLFGKFWTRGCDPRCRMTIVWLSYRIDPKCTSSGAEGVSRNWMVVAGPSSAGGVHESSAHTTSFAGVNSRACTYTILGPVPIYKDAARE